MIVLFWKSVSLTLVVYIGASDRDLVVLGSLDLDIPLCCAGGVGPDDDAPGVSLSIGSPIRLIILNTCSGISGIVDNYCCLSALACAIGKVRDATESK